MSCFEAASNLRILFAMVVYPVFTLILAGIFAYSAATLTGEILARSGFPLPPAARRIGCIDGLRGYLAISVIIHHFIIWTQVTRLGNGWKPPSIHLFNQLGVGAVALFFMTTGLVFYPRILSGFRSCSWVTTYIMRVFRIIPLIIVSVVLITLIIVARTGHSIDATFWLNALSWITAWGEVPLLGYEDSGRLNAYVLWSLWYEWLFYLFILPTCALAMDIVRHRLPSWAVPAGLFILGVSLQFFHRAEGKFWGMLIYIPLFAIGMLAFEVSKRESVAQILRSPRVGIAAFAALLVGMTLFQTPYELAMPLFGLFFICVACGNDIFILNRGGAVVLGECSYGIYLIHGTILAILFTELGSVTELFATKYLAALMPIATICAVLLTAGTYLIIERPGMRLGARIAATVRGLPFLTAPMKILYANRLELGSRDSKSIRHFQDAFGRQLASNLLKKVFGA